MLQVLHTFIVDLILIKDLLFFPLLEIMASHMVAFYGPQAAQTNEKPPPESFLNLTLTRHLHDEEPEPQEVCACLEVEPPQT